MDVSTAWFTLFFFAFIVVAVGGSILVGIGLMVLWIWALVDCLAKESSQGNDKLVWCLVIILTGWIGALIYILVRRPQRVARFGA